MGLQGSQQAAEFRRRQSLLLTHSVIAVWRISTTVQRCATQPGIK